MLRSLADVGTNINVNLHYYDKKKKVRDKWFSAQVTGINNEQHEVTYEDGDVIWHDLLHLHDENIGEWRLA